MNIGFFKSWIVRRPEADPSGLRVAPRPDWRGDPRTFWVVAAVILAIGVVLRLLLLDLSPFHHDEGVNGYFMTRLFRQGYYHYDPENYHGPSLYYAALVFAYLLGLTSFSMRLLVAGFGVGALWQTLGLRRTIGRTTSLATMALLALSPGAVFFSRYFIHEIMLIFFTLAMVVALMRYYDTRRPGLLLALGAWTALCFATKETAFISIGVIAIAFACAHVYLSLHSLLVRSDVAKDADVVPRPVRVGIEPLDLALWIASAVAVFLLISIVLYSSFFTYPEGVRGALQTFAIWRKTGQSAHVHPWNTYLNWLFRAESATLMLGGIGVVVALWRAENRKIVGCAFWAIGMLLAYSLIKYKTPWLALNISLPLSIMGGYAVATLLSGRARLAWLVGAVAMAAAEGVGLSLIRAPLWSAQYVVPLLVTLGCLVSAGLAFVTRRSFWIAALPSLILAGGVSLYQTIEINYYRYDDDRYVYVYAHTRREFLDLVSWIRKLVQASGTGNATAVSVTSAEHWPLSWYLRDLTQVGYHGKVVGLDTAVIVVGHVNQETELRQRLGERFTRIGVRPLRPGVDLVLFARADIARRAGLPALH